MNIAVSSIRAVPVWYRSWWFVDFWFRSPFAGCSVWFTKAVCPFLPEFSGSGYFSLLAVHYTLPLLHWPLARSRHGAFSRPQRSKTNPVSKSDTHLAWVLLLYPKIRFAGYSDVGTAPLMVSFFPLLHSAGSSRTTWVFPPRLC